MYKFLLTCLLLNIYLATCQETTVKFNDSLSKFENLPINNAISYENKYENTTSNTKQFLYNDYKNSVIFYDGNIYYDVKLKFDLYSNKILYKPKFNLITEIALFNDNIDYFIIENRKFLKVKIKEETHFYEELKINSECNLLVGYKKIMKENYNSDVLKYDFYDEFDLYLAINSSYILIKNKKDIMNYFPEHRKKINEFYNKNTPLMKANIILFYTNLFKDILEKND